MINYGRQTIDKKDVEEVKKVLESDFLTTGPKIKEFEDKFADYVGVKYAVAVANGTAALHLACLAAGLTDGDELITSPMTFAASANCGLYCGAKPRFVDINERGLINVDKIEEKVVDKTKVIVPVHYSGLACNMKKIKKVADKNDLIIIEDACHALGGKYKGSKIGDCQYSDMAVFSFHPVKHITTGEGGMITTNSMELYEKLLILRTHGITKKEDNFVNDKDGPWYCEMQELGFNYRLSDIQCALGVSQLNKIDEFVAKRGEIADKYKKAFEDMDNVEVIEENEGQLNAYHLFVVKVDKEKRLDLFNYLKENDILCQVHYIPVYWHPYYQKLGYERGLCPKAEDFYGKILSLPIYPSLKDEGQKEVIKAIGDYFE